MERRTIQAIEAKAARIPRRSRINPDRFVRWGIVGGALIGAATCIVLALAGIGPPGSLWEALVTMALGGATAGLMLGGLAGLIVSLFYEAFLGVWDFAGTLRKSKAGPPKDEEERVQD